MSHNEKYYKKTLKRIVVMSKNIAFILQLNVLRTNDSSNVVLHNNQMTAKVKLHRYLKIPIPPKMLVNQILIFQVVFILPKNYRSANHNFPQPLM